MLRTAELIGTVTPASWRRMRSPYSWNTPDDHRDPIGSFPETLVRAEPFAEARGGSGNALDRRGSCRSCKSGPGNIVCRAAYAGRGDQRKFESKAPAFGIASG